MKRLFLAALAAEDLQRTFVSQGGTADYVPPEEVSARMRSETQKWGAIVKETGAKAES